MAELRCKLCGGPIHVSWTELRTYDVDVVGGLHDMQEDESITSPDFGVVTLSCPHCNIEAEIEPYATSREELWGKIVKKVKSSPDLARWIEVK